MYIIINITMNQQQISFQLLRYFRISSNLINESCIPFLTHYFFYAVMRFTPPTVIDIIIMISGTRNSHFEEIRVLAHSRRTHKSTSRMSMNTNLIYIYKMMTLRQLLDSIFMIGQRIITHISISIIMIPFRAARMPAALSHRNNNKSGLCQTVGTGAHTGKRIINTFHLWPRINIIHNRINLS